MSRINPDSDRPGSRLAIERWTRPAMRFAASIRAVALDHRRTFHNIIIVLSLCLVATGTVLLPGPVTWAHGILLLGAAIATAMTVLAFMQQPSKRAQLANSDRDNTSPDILERRIEELQDLSWQLRDNQARYRDLLDAQAEIISCHDEDGRLTFVNRAFCRLFGVEPEAVLRTRFTPEVLETMDQGDSLAEGGRRLTTQRVQTSLGTRWLAMEQRSIPSASGSRIEMQTVGRDVTERIAYENELAQARDRALAADRAKSRFLAAMSHEIRTPMNGIMGMSSLLVETTQTSEQLTYTRAIEQSASTLLALIDEILDFSKIEAGHLQLAAAPFEPEACVQSAVELLAPRAHEKGLEIAWTSDPQLPARIIGDETRLRQILLNLIGNAIKFTDRGGLLVSLECQSVSHARCEIAISVKDTGIGLTESAKAGLFAEFEQADGPIAQRRGGTGLGLAISRRLAMAMGGDITVDSSYGRGATFKTVLGFDVDEVAEPALPTARAPSKSNVLLAFDLLLERRALGLNLSGLGASVREVGDDAFAEIEQAAASGHAVDCVIVDAQDDPAEAGAILRRARERTEGQVRGIVLLDALGRGNFKAFQDYGYDAFLMRPVRPKALAMQISCDATSACEPQRANATSPERLTDEDGRDDLSCLQGMRILLAEDNRINAMLTERMLQKTGAHVKIVGDGQAAVAAVTAGFNTPSNVYDLVLMDIHMPRLDGLDATRRIREAAREHGPGHPCPPIIALTANAFAEDRQRCLEAGCDDYLAKPFQRSDLEAILRQWVRQGSERPRRGAKREAG